jgi:hypothetical protein
MMPFMDDESVKDFNPQNIQSPEKKSKKGGRKTLKLKKKKCNCKNSIKNYLK